MPTIAVNGTTLAFDIRGPRDGIPLLMSHSLFLHRGMFRELSGYFATNYCVVTYDHRGQGESASADIDQLSMEVLTEDAAALIRALDLGPVHVVGNSMGGIVALRLAARYPELLRSAVPIGASAEKEHRLLDFGPLFEHLREHGVADAIGTLMYLVFGDTARAKQPALCAGWRESMLALPPSIGDVAYQVIHRSSVHEELVGTRVPVLAIVGAEDQVYPQPVGGKNIAHITGGSHITIPAAGHSAALERPQAVAGHLRSHFAAVDRAT